MKYLVITPAAYHMQHPKNGIETAVFNLFKEHSRKLIEARGINAFKIKISKAIEQINADHPESKPLISHWTAASYQSKDEKITLAYGPQFVIKILACEPEPVVVPAVTMDMAAITKAISEVKLKTEHNPS